MKRLIISDIHLGKRFNKNKFNYLKELFSKYDEVILNGDFWDYYSNSFDDFVNSDWSKLFPIMKNKTIYIYGNHDKEKWSDERVSLFSKEQASKFILEINNKKFIFIHGHETSNIGMPENKLFIKLDRFFGLNKFTLMLDYLLAIIHKDRYKKIEVVAKDLDKNELIITGHKHIPSINLDKKYAVSGCVLFGRSSYLEIDEKGNIEMIEERY